MDIEEAENRLFQLKQSMELLDLVIGKPIEEDTKLNIKAIETVLSELEKKEAIINEMAKDIKRADEFLDSMGYMGEYAKFTIEEIIEEYERMEKF